ncbi:RNA polymerase sigma factor SigJ [Saccharopolyspora shandongensis]|uniref:RNA polymerase sigma factor SigJ n=1 Tax=Saccharopolyspora shandongensis TaxID=418495 RepID=UPI003405EC94
MAESRQDTATRVFVAHRELLFSVVYNMLGSVGDTEDVLQETWLSWAQRNRAPDAAGIDNPRGYLVRVAVNQALAREADIRRRRETYIGPWLPEPLVTTDDPPASTDAVSMALLVVLESLSPAERAVFVLHEVFGYGHNEIAGVLGRSAPAVRQLAHRARGHVQARRPRYRADPHVRQAATERFVAAATGGDLNALLQILSPEVTLWTDGGGKLPAANLRPIRGRDKVARFLAGASARAPRGLTARYRVVNGDPAALLLAGESLFLLIVVDVTDRGDQVCGVYVVGNPDKLARID